MKDRCGVTWSARGKIVRCVRERGHSGSHRGMVMGEDPPPKDAAELLVQCECDHLVHGFIGHFGACTECGKAVKVAWGAT
jgi:hypothetical protein